MVLGDAVSKIETLVWIFNHISRFIAWSLFTLKGHRGNTFFDVTVTGQWSSPSVCLLRSRQEGEVNTSDLADPMIQAIMTSRRKKCANAQSFRKWRRRLWLKQLF